jgi:hypothetical protein
LGRDSSSKVGHTWTTALITKLWNVAWDLWEFRNAVFHQKMNHSQQEDNDALDLKVRDLSHKLNQTGLLPKDRHLMSISITRLLLLPRIQKVEWLHQATLALAHVKKRQFQLRRSRQEHYRRYHAMIESMQLGLHNWLNNSS